MLRIAAVSSDDKMRLELARAFDEAPPSWSVTLHDEPPPEADVVVCGPDERLEGAVMFDPAHPRDLVDTIRARAMARRRPILVVGATGGCGATSVALHLAAVGGGWAIEASGDDVRRRLGMASAKTWAPGLAEEPIELCALPVAPGFRVLLAPPDGSDEQVRTVVERCSSVAERVVIDCSARSLREIGGGDGIGVLVLAPTRPSAERARDLVHAHSSMRWAITTNRLGPGGALTRASIEEILQRRIAVELPCSAGLRDAEDEGRLLTTSWSPWMWQIKRLWRALAAA